MTYFDFVFFFYSSRSIGPQQLSFTSYVWSVAVVSVISQALLTAFNSSRRLHLQSAFDVYLYALLQALVRRLLNDIMPLL